MKHVVFAVTVALLSSSCSSPAQEKWSIIRDVVVRVSDGETVMLAGHSLGEYLIFIRGTSPVDDISVYLEIWSGDDALESRAEIFHGRAEPEEKKCGRVFLRDADISGAMLCIERFYPSVDTTEITRHSLQELLIGGRGTANQPAEPTAVAPTAIESRARNLSLVARLAHG